MAKILKSALRYKEPIRENLVEFIKTGLRKNADKTIIVDSASDRRWTGVQLESKICSVANYLIKDCKLAHGEICTLYGEPNDHFVILMLAVISAGGTSNYVTNKYRPREVIDTSRYIGSSLIISTKDLLQTLDDHLSKDDAHKKTKILSIDERFEDSYGPIQHLLHQKYPASSSDQTDVNSPSDLDESLLDDLAKQVSPSDLAVVQFSSGTTGKPKPIPRTHKNLCHLVASVDHEQLMDLKPGQVIAGSLPITHRPGLWALLACINSGSTFVLWSNTLDIEEALRIVGEYQVTVLSTALAFLAELGNKGVALKDKFDLTSLKHIITSGAKIVHSDLPKTIVKEFDLQTLRQCFGMTEAGWVFLLENSLAKDGHYLTVGHAVPGMEVAILDRQTLQPVGVEVRGELAVRGPQVFPGYLGETASTFVRNDFTDDGWFRTGDQAYYDDQELVFIEGRYKELMIFANDGRFFPTEIETMLSEHPAVESSCVVNLGQSEAGFDVARGFVTLKHDCRATEEQLLKFVNEISFEVTLEGGIRIIDKFPRLQNGKVDKFALKAMSL